MPLVRSDLQHNTEIIESKVVAKLHDPQLVP